MRKRFTLLWLVNCHENGVDDDTKGDKELNEGVKDEVADIASKYVVTGTACPSA